MGAPANAVRSSLSKPLFICEQDSTFQKAICYIPIIGTINVIRHDISIALKIGSGELSRHRAIELIILKNQYKFAGIINGVLTTAAAIAGIALGLFTFGSIDYIFYFFIVNVPMSIYSIYKNNQVLKELEDGPFNMKKIY